MERPNEMRRLRLHLERGRAFSTRRVFRGSDHGNPWEHSLRAVHEAVRGGHFPGLFVRAESRSNHVAVRRRVAEVPGVRGSCPTEYLDVRRLWVGPWAKCSTRASAGRLAAFGRSEARGGRTGSRDLGADRTDVFGRHRRTEERTARSNQPPATG